MLRLPALRSLFLQPSHPVSLWAQTLLACSLVKDTPCTGNFGSLLWGTYGPFLLESPLPLSLSPSRPDPVHRSRPSPPLTMLSLEIVTLIFCYTALRLNRVVTGVRDGITEAGVSDRDGTGHQGAVGARRLVPELKRAHRIIPAAL